MRDDIQYGKIVEGLQGNTDSLSKSLAYRLKCLEPRRPEHKYAIRNIALNSQLKGECVWCELHSYHSWERFPVFIPTL